MTENLTGLENWVIGPNQRPTRVALPAYIDYRVARDLHEYHPMDPGPGLFELFLTGHTDDDDRQYAKLNLHTPEWNTKFKEVADGLVLYIERDEQDNEILLDKDIKRSDVVFEGGWRITEWRFVKYYNADTGQFDTQEIIRWQSAGREVISSYRWPVYLPILANQNLRGTEHTPAVININVGNTTG